MKKSILFLCLMCYMFSAYSQTRPGLIAMTFERGAYNGGTLLLYNGGDTVVQAQYDLSFPAEAYGSLMQSPIDGLMYGFTHYAGANNAGSLFSYEYLSGSYTTLVDFQNDYRHGYNPCGTPFLASDGKLYGVLGKSGNSVLVSYTFGRDSVEQLFPLDFTEGGGELIQSTNGRLYGMTTVGGTYSGGYIYEYDISRRHFSILHHFPGNSFAMGSLLEVGRDTLYGVTSGGGANYGGILFRFVISNNNYTILHTFVPGSSNTGSVILATDGKLYGTASDLSAGGADGNLFSYDLATGIYTDIYDFRGGRADGSQPRGSLYQASDGMLYGLTYWGGAYNCGTIFRYDLANATYKKMVDLDSITGRYPQYGHFIQYQIFPSIRLDPASQRVCQGEIVSFVSLSDSSSATVQWQMSTDSGATFVNMSGAISDTLRFTSALWQNMNYYRAVFSYNGRKIYSSAARLTVYQKPVKIINGSICEGQAYNFNARNYFVQGTYSDTISGSSMHGCDSIVILHLITYASATTAIKADICAGTGYTVGSHLHTSAGSYIDTLSGVSIHGCDSIVTIQLSVYPVMDTSISRTLCQGQSYSVGSHIHHTSGSFTDTLHGVSVHGCDSIVYLKLTVNSNDFVVKNDTIYRGEYFVVGKDSLRMNGTYFDTLMNRNGCDSVVMTHLTVFDDPMIGDYRFSPNPVIGTFTIQSNYSGLVSVYIVNILGQRIREYIMTGHQKTFDINDLASGIYEVMLVNDRHVIGAKQIVKE